MKSCFLLVCFVVALLSVPSTQAANSGIPPQTPLLLTLLPPLWEERELRHRVLLTLERRHGVEVLEKLPRFQYVVVKGEKGEKGRSPRRGLAEVKNITWSVRPQVGQARSTPSRSVGRVLPQLPSPGGKWAVLAQSFLTPKETTEKLSGTCGEGTLVRPRHLLFQGREKNGASLCLLSLLRNPKTVWAAPLHPVRVQNHHGLNHIFGSTFSKEDYPSDEEIITIMDTGLDSRHCFFNTPDPPLIHTTLPSPELGEQLTRAKLSHPGKVIAIVNTQWSTPNGTETSGDFEDMPNGHGTHVAGTAVGDPCPEVPEQPKRGGRLIFFDFQHQGEEWLQVPPLLRPLLEASYEAGSRVFSLSWGSSLDYYSTYAKELDEFVRDKGDAVVLVAAGNEGWGGVGSPATAKNIVAVGASFNTNDRWRSMLASYYRNRHPYFQQEEVEKFPHRYSSEHLADFSSRGPIYDGRRKPTLVVPGAYLLSARAKGTSQHDLLLMQGTSMATPLLARAVAALRQKLRKTTSLQFIPSSLIRALLAAYTRPITGGAMKQQFSNGTLHLIPTQLQLNESDQGLGELQLGGLWRGGGGGARWKVWRQVEWNKPPPALCFEVVEGSRVAFALSYDSQLTSEHPEVGWDLWLAGTGVGSGDPLNMEKKVTLLYPPKGTKVRVQVYSNGPQHTLPHLSLAWSGGVVAKGECAAKCLATDHPLPCPESDEWRLCGLHDWGDCGNYSPPPPLPREKDFRPVKPVRRRGLERLRRSSSHPRPSSSSSLPWIIVGGVVAVVGVGAVAWGVIQDEREHHSVFTAKKQ